MVGARKREGERKGGRVRREGGREDGLEKGARGCRRECRSEYGALGKEDNEGLSMEGGSAEAEGRKGKQEGRGWKEVLQVQERIRSGRDGG